MAGTVEWLKMAGMVALRVRCGSEGGVAVRG